MSYFAPYIDETGLHLPTRSDLMNYFLDGYRNIFGDDLYLGEDTQDYQMISLYAKAWEDLASVLLDVYSSRNPDWATNETLDGICAINGISRKTASASVAVLHLTGTAGATIGSGNTARDTSGFSWLMNDTVTFDDDGNADATAVCTETGAIAAPAGTINIIESPSYDWYTVTNANDAIIGSDDENDIELRNRRRQSVALSARSTRESLNDSIVNVNGVSKARVIENSTAVNDATTGTNAHSIHVIVDGGNNGDIAKAIYMNKAPGIGTNGSVSYTYRDVYGNDNVVKFSRPTRTKITVKVLIAQGSEMPDDNAAAEIKNGISEYINAIEIGDTLNVHALYSVFYAHVTGRCITSGINAYKGSETTPSTSVITQSLNNTFYATPDDVTIVRST